MYLCHCFFGDKKITHSNTFAHHGKPVVESVPSLISPRSCFSEDTEHDILSSRLDCFRDAAVPSVCAETVCASSSNFQSILPRAVCFSFRDVHCLVAQTGEPNYLVARVPVPSALNISAWRELLQGYEDSIVCEFLEFGWPVGFVSNILPFISIAAPFNFRNKFTPICTRKFHLAGLPVLLMPYLSPMALWFRLSIPCPNGIQMSGELL